MIIIRWRGLGLPIMMAGGVVISLALAPFDKAYLLNHTWPRLFAFGAGAAAVYFLAAWRENNYGARDSLYWIPMKFWAIALVAGGIISLFVPASSLQVAARTNPEPVYAATKAPTRIVTANGLRLQGIFYRADGQSTAIINNQTVSVGDRVGDSTVSALEPQSVTLKAASGNVTVLKLSQLSR